jgi:hypothetical protein
LIGKIEAYNQTAVKNGVDAKTDVSPVTRVLVAVTYAEAQYESSVANGLTSGEGPGRLWRANAWLAAAPREEGDAALEAQRIIVQNRVSAARQYQVASKLKAAGLIEEANEEYEKARQLWLALKEHGRADECEEQIVHNRPCEVGSDDGSTGSVRGMASPPERQEAPPVAVENVAFEAGGFQAEGDSFVYMFANPWTGE